MGSSVTDIFSVAEARSFQPTRFLPQKKRRFPGPIRLPAWLVVGLDRRSQPTHAGLQGPYNG